MKLCALRTSRRALQKDGMDELGSSAFLHPSLKFTMTKKERDRDILNKETRYIHFTITKNTAEGKD